MESPELKPCPFCGSKEVEVYRPEAAAWSAVITCNACMAWGPEAKENEDAAERWNSRADA